MAGSCRNHQLRIQTCADAGALDFRILIICLIAGIMLVLSPALAGDVPTKPYWVYFTDKNTPDPNDPASALETIKTNLSERACQRRLARSSRSLVEIQDLPVDDEYLNGVFEITNTQPRVVSRWLNAVSLELSPDQVEQLLRLPFVKNIQSVGRFARPPHDEENLVPDVQPPSPRRDDHDLDYGNSYLQNAFLSVPDLHDRGYLGAGILIGLTDTGFNNLDHNCFEDLDVVATHDFVNGDEDVGDGDIGNGDHGTQVLSIIGGFDPGRFVGIAPQASFVLAKTESSEWERRVEEDYWIAAVEWMDSLGVDIVSASLSYYLWYDYEDLDGETAPITIAANRAVEVGMVVVVSMGNRGVERYPNNKMGAPADGFAVFAVGALEMDSTLSAYSSIGPTFDGRIKPDFVTLGTSVRVASPTNDANYRVGAGTSLSAPGISGLCALLLEADERLSPATLGETLRAVAHNHEEPDTLIGWGIPDGLDALEQVLGADQKLVINLSPGWNIISNNLASQLARNSIPLIFVPVVERQHLRMVRDSYGNFYAPEFEFNNIPDWHPLQGYQVRVTAPDSLVFEGQRIEPAQPIRLEAGWHLVAYLPDFSLPAEAAFNSLVENHVLVLARDQNGGFYLPDHDYCDMEDLTPGRGYQLCLRMMGLLVYPESEALRVARCRTSVPEYFTLPERGAEAMFALIYAGRGISDGDEIGFFDSRQRLVGSGVFKDGRCGVAIWGEDAGVFPEAKIYRRGAVEITSPSYNWLEGSGGFQPRDYAVLRADFDRASDNATDNVLGVSVIPNPFNDFLTVDCLVNYRSDIEVAVFDLLGRRMGSREFKGRLTGRAVFSASGWAGGSYILEATSGEQQRQLLVTHIK